MNYIISPLFRLLFLRYAYLCVGMCICECRCLQSPEEEVRKKKKGAVGRDE